MSSSTSGGAPKSDARKYDGIMRGIKKPSPIGSTTFIGLRSADILLQYAILKNGLGAGLLHKVGLQTLPQGLPMSTGWRIVDRIGLSPYRLILLSMATGSTLKQIYWLLGTSEEMLEPALAVGIAGYNSIVNSLNDLLFTCALTSGSLSGSETFPQPPLIVGGLLYVLGMAIEITSETQRRLFKKKPENKGKLYTGGLFGYVRHANYAGYMLWRTGYGMAAGGFTWGTITLLWNATDFTLRGIPALQQWCAERYGTQYQAYERQTPYKLVPYVY